MSGKNTYGPYNVSQGGTGGVVADPTPSAGTVTSGATEPTWPTTRYATVNDGAVVWTAIYAREAQGSVTGVLNAQVFQHDQTTYPNHYFQYGKIEWLTGLNAGFTSAVRDSFGPVTTGSTTSKPYLFMLEVAPNPIEEGDTFVAVVGCNKQRNTCQLFNNMDNMRGFPDMPTEDRALATPNISNQGYSPRSTK